MKNPIDSIADLADKAGGNSGPKPHIRFMHLWTDKNGISHQSPCVLENFELKGVGDAVRSGTTSIARVPRP